MAEISDWFESVFPYDLGDSNHRWSWLMRVDGDGKPDILWLHRCLEGRPTVCWIDITSGTKHHLITPDPLTIEASVLCPVGCGDHGFIRNGTWVPA